MGTRNPKPRQCQPGMDLTSFKAWVACAETKQVCVYFEGRHLADCANQDTVQEAREAFSKGLIELCQRRLPGEDGKLGALEYICQKRAVVRVPLINGDPWQPYIIKTAPAFPPWIHHQ